MILFKRILMIWLLVLHLIGSELIAQDHQSAQQDFFEANRAYKNDRFQEAIDGYLKLIENGFENGHIYYNLGNAYYRLGNLGRAILFFERARLLLPRDDDLLFNLAHARNQTVDVIDDFRNAPLTDILGLDSINVYEVFFAFTILNFSLFIILGIRLYRKPEWSFYLSIVLAIFVGIGGCALALKWYGYAFDDRAVVISEEIEVRAGPDPGDTALFLIHDGAIVSYERAEGNWTLLHLSEDKRGWAEAKQLERIVNEKGI
jgi:tetratricopeptide (TPR) repeat protein